MVEVAMTCSQSPPSNSWRRVVLNGKDEFGWNMMRLSGSIGFGQSQTRSVSAANKRTTRNSIFH